MVAFTIERMIEATEIPAPGRGGLPPVPPVDADLVREWTTRLSSGSRELSDAERIELIRALEELSCAAAAAQSVTTAAFDTSQRAEQADRGVPAARQGRGVAAQVALARRESPHRGQQHLELARILGRGELPHTRIAFAAGKITEWKVTLVARETACLSLADRHAVDAELAANPDRIEAMGEGELVAEARKIAYRLDPHSVVERRRRAEAQRRVTLRPAPDVMSQLSALLPVKDGVAIYAVLKREADRLRAAGDERSRGQIMADTLVERVLSDPTPQRAGRPGLMISLVVTDQVLFGTSDEPGHIDGYGPVPADLVREWVTASAVDEQTKVWLRRLYVTPETGALVAMDSRSRFFPAGLADLIRLRDRTCRTPWCDAPIRHTDHVEPSAGGGPTAGINGDGLCVACNLAKEAIGWQARPRPGPRHVVETRTPTGHTYRSTAPPLVPPRFIEVSPGRWTLVA